MIKQPVEEQKLREYLLGILPEAEAEHLDEMSLSDDDFASQLDAAENDLIDTYVRGELTGNTLARFQSHYLASPRRREKVAFAKTFHSNLKSGRINDVSDAPARAKSAWLPFLPAQWGFAAAALLVLLISGYLVWDNAQLRNGMLQARSEQKRLLQQEQELRTRIASGEEATRELAMVQKKIAELQQQLEHNGSTNPIAVEPEVQLLAFNLSPQTRGGSQLAAITIPKDTDFLALNLGLEITDFPAYTAALKDPGTDQVVWQSKKIPYDGKSESIAVAVPVSKLKPQTYMMEVSGLPKKGKSEIVSSYPFRVLIR